MAKKRKKKARSRKGRKHVPASQLPALGEKQLREGKFSEAVKTFRQLTEANDDKRWRSFHRQAYQGRIGQLLAKGMAKEALAIYRNMVDYCQTENPSLYFSLLLKGGYAEKAVALFVDLEESLAKTAGQMVAELFAAYLLSGHEQVLRFLPDGHLLKSQFPSADMALQAYCDGNNGNVEDHLRKITFRSPYRNFRLALKGMLAFEEDRTAAEDCFAKIPATSIFRKMVIPYRSIIDYPPGKSAKLTSREQQVVQSLQGISKSTARFIEGITARQNNAVQLFTFLVGRQKFLSGHKLRDICYRLLIHAENKYVNFVRIFGELDYFQYNRMLALGGEVDGDYWEACQDWQEAFAGIPAGDDPQDNLRKALILRHCVELLEREDGAFDYEQRAEMLEKSLEYDSGDLSCWLKLLDLAAHDGRQRYYKLVNRMLAEFPNNVEVLLRGVMAAVDRGAYKKAGKLADKVLQIDPINSKAKQLLIDAHLEHGRKLARQGKFVLAVKECQAAAQDNNGNYVPGVLEICHGLILVLAGDKDAGLTLHEQGVGMADNLVSGCFQACMEARLLQYSGKLLKPFDRRLKDACKGKPEVRGLLDFAALLQRYGAKEKQAVQNLRPIVTSWLASGLKLDLDKGAYLQLCAILQQQNYFELLTKYGKKADKLWPDSPLFVFYYLCGKSRAGSKKISNRELDRLEDMLELAELQHDRKSVMLIEELLKKLLFSGKISPNGAMGNALSGFLEMFENNETMRDEMLQIMESEDFLDADFDDEKW